MIEKFHTNNSKIKKLFLLFWFFMMTEAVMLKTLVWNKTLTYLAMKMEKEWEETKILIAL